MRCDCMILLVFSCCCTCRVNDGDGSNVVVVDDAVEERRDGDDDNTPYVAVVRVVTGTAGDGELGLGLELGAVGLRLALAVGLALVFGVTVCVTGDDDAGSDDDDDDDVVGCDVIDVDENDDQTIIRGIGNGSGGEKAVGARLTMKDLCFESVCLDDAIEPGLGLGLRLAPALDMLVVEGGVDLLWLGEPCLLLTVVTLVVGVMEVLRGVCGGLVGLGVVASMQGLGMGLGLALVLVR